jgi:hypothetical protein
MLFSWFFQVSFLILWHNINWHNLSLRLCQSQLRKDTWESSTTSEAPDAQGITREPLFCERRGELTVKKKKHKANKFDLRQAPPLESSRVDERKSKAGECAPLTHATVLAQALRTHQARLRRASVGLVLLPTTHIARRDARRRHSVTTYRN